MKARYGSLAADQRRVQDRALLPRFQLHRGLGGNAPGLTLVALDALAVDDRGDLACAKLDDQKSSKRKAQGSEPLSACDIPLPDVDPRGFGQPVRTQDQTPAERGLRGNQGDGRGAMRTPFRVGLQSRQSCHERRDKDENAQSHGFGRSISTTPPSVATKTLSPASAGSPRMPPAPKAMSRSTVGIGMSA